MRPALLIERRKKLIRQRHFFTGPTRTGRTSTPQHPRQHMETLMKKIQSVAFLISISLLMFSYTAEAQKLREAEVAVPDSVTYGFFFQHLSDLDDFALRQIAIGQAGERCPTPAHHATRPPSDKQPLL